MRTTEQIVQTLRERKTAWQPVMAKRQELRDAYNGDIVVPLPELDRNEKTAVANLIAQGIDQLAMRVASVTPNIVSPPLRPGFKKSEEYARTRRQAGMGWMEDNEIDLRNYRRAERMLGYAASPVWIGPDPKRQIPEWKFRDPLQTYPAPMNDPDDMCPTDCIFTYSRTLAELQHRYPDAMRKLNKGPAPKPDDKYEVLEYVDCEQISIIVIGRAGRGDLSAAGDPAVELERIDNRTGLCLAVVPQRITLDRPQSQFDQMIGLYLQQAKLMALEVIAVQKGVFPTTVLESYPNAPGLPELVTGDTVHPGWTGLVNIVRNGALRELISNPGYQTNQTIDRLERAQRLTGGVPAEFGGESSSNIRTGRRGEAVTSATVDFHVQMHQKILARSGGHEFTRAIEVSKAWFGSKPKSFTVNWNGEHIQEDYTPNECFEKGSKLIVSYSHAGSDVNGLNIGIGQMIGTGMISQQTGREMHPWVDDAELEHDRTVSEALERALLASVEQRASLPPEAGGLHPKWVAKIAELVVTNKKDLAEAILEVDRLASEEQSPAVDPVAPDSPEAMPGLAPGGEAGTNPPMPNVGDLGSLLMQLRGPQLTVPSERGAA